MFDIGFTEILVIGAVALVVVGPERLPEAVRTAGLWFGRLKRSLRETRRELEEQLGADDIRRQLHNEDIMRSLEKVKQDVHTTLNEQIDLDGDLYPPGHENHDPNNDIDDEPASTDAATPTSTAKPKPSIKPPAPDTQTPDKQ